MTGMEGIYNRAKICPFNNQDCDLTTEGLTLDPEIVEIMASSEDYDELKWAWEQWRNNSGKLMRSEYLKYVELVNKAAVENGNLNLIYSEWNNFSSFNDIQAKMMKEKGGASRMKTTISWKTWIKCGCRSSRSTKSSTPSFGENCKRYTLTK